jgi:hypothetical protein
MDRRHLLLGAAAAGALATLDSLAGCGVRDTPRPLALVYRGPVSCSGCSEAVAQLLATAPTGFRTEFCGPDERRDLSSDALAEAVVYAQPGGGSVGPAWRKLRDHADEVRDYVRSGGRYLGFCLGGYLAGNRPGFGLIPGKVGRYIDMTGATVDDTDDALVPVTWRGRPRTMYFQDGPTFELDPDAPATVLARYDTGAVAAVVAAYGSGRVGVVGPHPEADESWYADAGLRNPDGIRSDLGHDLVESTVHGDQTAGS